MMKIPDANRLSARTFPMRGLVFFAAAVAVAAAQAPVAAQTQAPAVASPVPVSPSPLKPVAADASPSFGVATIKPDPSGWPGLMGLGMQGHVFAVKNASLIDLIAFAYGVQAKQIVNGTGWMENDRYDVIAVPDQDGVPNIRQLKTMTQKLLADRFKLTFHSEKRELSAFVLTVESKGPKLSATKFPGPVPIISGFRPGPTGLTLTARNLTLEGFAHLLQMTVLNRPVVDRTGIPGSFDFQLTFTPDDSMFNGRMQTLDSETDKTEAAPNLYEAIQRQLGLKLKPEKALVDVIAIDHDERPSAN
ncbi:MAG: TIGR03435 family protein [Terracidiphilus sp.]